MAITYVTLPIEYFPDPTKGRPVFSGSIYVGEPNLDPEIEANRIDVTLRQQDGTEVVIPPASQPLLTGAGGVVLYEGSPVTMLVDGNYSLKVLDKQGGQIYYIEDAFDGVPISKEEVYELTDIWFDTVADMKAAVDAQMIEGVILATKGYYTPGDYGGAKYLVSAPQAVDGFGDHTLANGNAALLQSDGLVNVMKHGATGNGVTDDNPSILAAASAVTNNSTLLFPAGRYLAEATQTDPYTGSINSMGVIFSSLRGVKVEMNGSSIVQSTTNSTNGFFVFDNCQDCCVSGSIDGVWNTGTGQTTNSLAQAVGSTDGLKVVGLARGGRALCTFRSSNGLASGNRPKNTEVKGFAIGTEYAVNYTHCDDGHIVDVVCDGVLRGLFITGTSNIIGQVSGSGFSGTILNFSTRNGDNISNVDITLTCKDFATGIAFRVSDATACEIKDIRLHGTIESVGSFGSNTGVEMVQMGNISSKFINIDLSDLSLIMSGSASEAVGIVPDLAAEIRNIYLPSILSSNNATLIDVNNSSGALIENLYCTNQTVKYSSSTPTSLTCFRISGGVVNNVYIINCSFQTDTTGSTSVSLTTVDGLVVDGCTSNKEIYVVGSTNIRNGNNDVEGGGYVLIGSVANNTKVTWKKTIIVTSGAASIDRFRRGTPGQKLTLAASGGTIALINSAQLKLAGGADYSSGANGTIELVCIDPVSTEASVFAEVSRSIN